MLRIATIFLFLSSAAFAEETVDTVDGPKATGYLGLGDMATLHYEKIPLGEGDLPESFDWRDVKGVFGPIRNQGSCGSCYAFAITGALEASEVVQTGRPLQDLSEQQIVSCSDSYGCGGGFMSTAYYAVKPGLTDEASFPYTARNSRCRTNLDIKAKASKYSLLGTPRRSPTTTEIKTALINKGPLFITVMAGGSGWNGGGSKVTSCRKRGSTNHMVVLSGYDKNGWIIRNSWGARWGDKGYAHIGYGCDLVAEQAGFVTVE